MSASMQVSLVDFSAIDRRDLGYVRALRDLHRDIDPHHDLRMMLGNALRPPAITVCPLGGGLLALLSAQRRRTP